MKIDDLMTYATNLADSDFRHEWEDLAKLAYLCEDIAESRRAGSRASDDVEAVFQQTIKSFFESNGKFRNVVEQCPAAKQLILGT